MCWGFLPPPPFQWVPDPATLRVKTFLPYHLHLLSTNFNLCHLTIDSTVKGIKSFPYNWLQHQCYKSHCFPVLNPNLSNNSPQLLFLNQHPCKSAPSPVEPHAWCNVLVRALITCCWSVPFLLWFCIKSTSPCTTVFTATSPNSNCSHVGGGASAGKYNKHVQLLDEERKVACASGGTLLAWRKPTLRNPERVTEAWSWKSLQRKNGQYLDIDCWLINMTPTQDSWNYLMFKAMQNAYLQSWLIHSSHLPTSGTWFNLFKKTWQFNLQLGIDLTPAESGNVRWQLIPFKDKNGKASRNPEDWIVASKSTSWFHRASSNLDASQEQLSNKGQY